MTEKHLKKQYWINTLETGHIYINDGENHMSWQGVVDKLNELHEENQQLRKFLKRELMALSGNLCDACKHEEEDNTNNWLVGIDFDVKCRKGHEILLDDEEQECEDFELRLDDLE